jgi:hypothetical protein
MTRRVVVCPSSLPTLEDLRPFTLVEFEEHIHHLFSKREPTEEEAIYLRHARRLVANKVYARTSRAHKKEHVEQLEREIQEVREANTRLMRRIELLEEDRVKMQIQLSHYQHTPLFGDSITIMEQPMYFDDLMSSSSSPPSSLYDELTDSF